MRVSLSPVWKSQDRSCWPLLDPISLHADAFKWIHLTIQTRSGRFGSNVVAFIWERRGCLTVSLGWKRQTPSTGLTEMCFWNSLVVTQRDVSASAPPVSIAHTWAAARCPRASVVITMRCWYSLNLSKWRVGCTWNNCNNSGSTSGRIKWFINNLFLTS